MRNFYWEVKINASENPHSKEATWRANHAGRLSVLLSDSRIDCDGKCFDEHKIIEIVFEDYSDRALGLLEQMGVVDKSRQIPAKLSGGETAGCHSSRVDSRPKVILADEPTGNLDERTGAEVESTS